MKQAEQGKKEKAFEMKCMLCCPLSRGKRGGGVGVSTKPTRLTAGIEAKGSRAGTEQGEWAIVARARLGNLQETQVEAEH